MSVSTNVKDEFLPADFAADRFRIAVSTLLINILSLAMPIMMLQVYDRVLPKPDSSTLPLLIGGVSLAILLEMVLRIMRSYLFGFKGAVYEHKLSTQIYKSLLYQNIADMKAKTSGEFLNYLSAPLRMKDAYSGYKFSVNIELVFVTIYLAFIYIIAGHIVLIPILGMGGITASAFLKKTEIERLSREREQEDNARFSFIIESLLGAMQLKSFTLERIFAKKYEVVKSQSTSLYYKSLKHMLGIFDGALSFSHFMMALVIAACAYQVIMGSLTAGGLIACVILAGRAMQPILRALNFWTKMHDIKMAKEQVSHLVGEGRETMHSSAPQLHGESILHVNGVCSTSAKTRGASSIANFSVVRGSTLLLDGENRRDVSRLLNIITGRHEPQKGRVLLDHHNVSALVQKGVSEYIGYVDDSPVIFHGSIRDNVTCFGTTPDKDVKAVVRALKLDKELSKLPDGWDTWTNLNQEAGLTDKLKQHIALVRCLAKRPPFLILNQADLKLDVKTQDLLVAYLQKIKNQTGIILVSNNEIFHGLADRMYVLQSDAGRDFSGSNVRYIS